MHNCQTARAQGSRASCWLLPLSKNEPAGTSCAAGFEMRPASVIGMHLLPGCFSHKAKACGYALSAHPKFTFLEVTAPPMAL
jgi:hypothetical protein